MMGFSAPGSINCVVLERCSIFVSWEADKNKFVLTICEAMGQVWTWAWLPLIPVVVEVKEMLTWSREESEIFSL